MAPLTRSESAGAMLDSRRRRPSKLVHKALQGQADGAPSGATLSAPPVPQIDLKGAAIAERHRTARRTLEECMAGSNSTQKKKLTAPVGGMTARDAMTERQQHAADCTMWAQQLQQAVQDGIDSGVADSLLESGVKRILELEQLAVEQQAAAKAVAEARAALRATPISVPVTRVGSTAARRAAAAARCPLGEGSLVQLKGLEEVLGLSAGCFDVPLAEFNGRKGRVSREPPPWVIKAVPVGASRRTGGVVGGKSSRSGPTSGAAPALTAANVAALAAQTAEMLAPDVSDRPSHDMPLTDSLPVVEGLELVPVLLDARHTDKDPHRGVWIAVPACNIKVLQQ